MKNGIKEILTEENAWQSPALRIPMFAGLLDTGSRILPASEAMPVGSEGAFRIGTSTKGSGRDRGTFVMKSIGESVLGVGRASRTMKITERFSARSWGPDDDEPVSQGAENCEYRKR